MVVFLYSHDGGIILRKMYIKNRHFCKFDENSNLNNEFIDLDRNKIAHNLPYKSSVSAKT